MNLEFEEYIAEKIYSVPIVRLTGMIKLAGTIVEAISGHNINGIKEALASENIFTKFKEQKSIEDKIKDFFTGLLAERGNRLVNLTR